MGRYYRRGTSRFPDAWTGRRAPPPRARRAARRPRGDSASDGRVEPMRVALGSDHAGYELKAALAATWPGRGHEVLDLGTDSADRPGRLPRLRVGRRAGGGRRARRPGRRGLRHRGSACRSRPTRSRACAPRWPTTRPRARLAREHNHANVLCLGGPADRRCRSRSTRSRRGSTAEPGEGPPPGAPGQALRARRGGRLERRSHVAPSPLRRWLADDPEVTDLLGARGERQTTTLQLIASENFASPAVLAAAGLGPHQQVLRGLPGAPLLRRQPGGRRGRGPRAPARSPRSSAPTTPTSSPTPAPTPTSPSTRRCSSPGTRCWPCASTRAAT